MAIYQYVKDCFLVDGKHRYIDRFLCFSSNNINCVIYYILDLLCLTIFITCFFLLRYVLTNTNFTILHLVHNFKRV